MKFFLSLRLLPYCLQLPAPETAETTLDQNSTLERTDSGAAVFLSHKALNCLRLALSLSTSQKLYPSLLPLLRPHKSSMKQQACTLFSLSLKCSAPPTLILKGNKYSNKKNEDFSELFLLLVTNANEFHS
jgi:hypothetical protein